MGEVGLGLRVQVVFFWLCGSFNIFLFHIITTTIRYAVVYLSANDCVIIASVDYHLKYNELFGSHGVIGIRV